MFITASCSRDRVCARGAEMFPREDGSPLVDTVLCARGAEMCSHDEGSPLTVTVLCAGVTGFYVNGFWH